MKKNDKIILGTVFGIMAVWFLYHKCKCNCEKANSENVNAVGEVVTEDIPVPEEIDAYNNRRVKPFND